MIDSDESGHPRPRVLVALEAAAATEVTKLLRDRFTILSAGSSEQALELLDEHDDVAVALVDSCLSTMRGSELLSRARDIRPRTRRVLLVSDADIAAVCEAVNEGRIDHLLRRPFGRELVGVFGELAAEYERGDDRVPASGSQPADADEHELARQLEEARRHLRSSDEELARLTRELEVLSFLDPLTGLYNHRAFQERMREELARAMRYDHPLSLILCDVDNFSTVNSRLGFQIGDETLRRLAASLFGDDSRLPGRRSDISARFGGELFAVALPETDKSGALIKAERIRELAADLPSADGIRLSVSIGLASFPDDAIEAEALLAAAQRALQLAKSAGKNQVVQAGDEDDEDDEDDGMPHAVQPILGSGPPMFPSHHQRLAEIVAALERDQAVAALYVDLSGLHRVEQEYGLARHAALFAQAGTLLHGLQGTKLRRDDLICRTEVDDAYVCVLSPARHKNSGASLDLGAIARRVEGVLEEGLGAELARLGTDRPRFAVGYSRVLNNPLMRPERLVARLIDEARQSANMLRERTIHRDKSQLQELILSRHVRSFYQPIVHLESGETFGFEALSRGPQNTRLESPIELFAVADEVDLTFELDRACFRGALRSAIGLEPVHRLFVNILPLSFYDATFIENEVSRLVEDANLTPANLVFEITERLAIENFSAFRTALARYTAMGFGVAIDDVGTRHSNLEAVMALRPHFIKISDVLTRGVSCSTVKREMLRSLKRIGGSIDAVIVAEGIEDADDLAVLSDLGVRYGQGFFLARPGPPFPVVGSDVRDTVRALAKGRRVPIPEPDPEFDEDGDYRERRSSTTGVHLAVVKRIQSVPGHEAAKSMIERMERSRGQSPALATGTSPGTTIVPVDLDGSDTGKHRASEGESREPEDSGAHDPVPRQGESPGQFLEWTPIREEDLGGDPCAPGSSLLSSLRQRRDSEPPEPEQE